MLFFLNAVLGRVPIKVLIYPLRNVSDFAELKKTKNRSRSGDFAQQKIYELIEHKTKTP